MSDRAAEIVEILAEREAIRREMEMDIRQGRTIPRFRIDELETANRLLERMNVNQG